MRTGVLRKNKKFLQKNSNLPSLFLRRQFGLLLGVFEGGKTTKVSVFLGWTFLANPDLYSPSYKSTLETECPYKTFY